ncbi:ABC transporter substrate-binding protein [Arthrobacter crusticola]|uniref:ABC transporter substrate-binding protein n=1 Tax=Arthrobacter crusticola TaxID=2547960 RepID=A0A4R5U1S4_9MICC|nr:zinc ABC transporter substrate-binding protein [Arthrobacter crusticola]TDK27571.1 ABC transporter substrate-binding protein [Arthrobacter crusticola]
MSRAPLRRTASLAGLAVLALTASACGGNAGAGNAADTGSEPLQVVTGTNVYGSIVEAIGGDRVEVTAIVDSLSQDPHSYEATVQDKLAVSKADLLVENGGGYDAFLHRLADETGLDHDRVVTAVSVSGLEGAPAEDEHTGEAHAEDGGHGHGSFNEHVWYSPAAMKSLAGALGDTLGTLDEANAADYEERAERFQDSLSAIEESLAAGGEGAFAATEPVPVYLLEAAGLTDATVPEYTEAVEEGNDVPVGVLNEMRELLASGSVEFLAYNEQTEGPQTQSVRSAAEQAGVPVVDFTETLPEGQDYLAWMEANAESVLEALNAG